MELKEVGSIDKYIPSLTGLRALAAFMVYFHHFNPWYTEGSRGNFFGWVLNEFHIGVSIFFVLSGFLIYLRYFNSWESGNFKWKAYAINRIARIYPIFFILTTITFICYYLTGYFSNYTNKETGIIYFLNITLLKGFFDNFKFSGIVQGWSLTVEECFYFFAPVIFYFIRNRKLLFLLAIIYGAGIFLVYIFKYTDHLFGFFGSYRFMFDFTFFGRCFEFFAGMLLARFLSKQATFRRTSAFQFTLIGGVYILVCSFILALIKQHYNTHQGIYHPYGIGVNNFILPIGICLFLYGLIKEKTLISDLLSSSIFQTLGKSSYVFYLIHMGVFHEAISYIFPVFPYILPFILLNIFSIIIYSIIEEPICKIIKTSVINMSVVRIVSGSKPKCD